MIVVDASVAFKWLVDEEDSDRAAAFAAKSDLIAPSLLRAELGNALCTKVRRGDIDMAGALETFALLDRFVEHWVELDRLADAALALACELSHPIYDCFYLALAERDDLPVATADERLLERCRGTRLAHRFADWRG